MKNAYDEGNTEYLLQEPLDNLQQNAIDRDEAKRNEYDRTKSIQTRRREMRHHDERRYLYDINVTQESTNEQDMCAPSPENRSICRFLNGLFVYLRGLSRFVARKKNIENSFSYYLRGLL